MNPQQLLTALERERELLREFYILSEKQLLVLETEDLEAVDEILEQRSDLMLDLSALESNLSTWIEHIRFEENSVSEDVVEQLRSIKEDIIALANEILLLDDQAQTLLDLMARAAARKNTHPKKGLAYVGGPSMTCIN